MRNKTIYLIQLFIPLQNNSGEAFELSKFAPVKKELADRFGGLTAFTRAPAEGIWEPDPQTLHQEKIIIFEVLTETLDRPWWQQYRRKLEIEFSQDSIQILAQVVEKI